MSSRCPNCGAATSTRYCGECGQRLREGRYTLRGILGQVVADAFNLERGLPATVWGLTVRPGGTVRDYLAGRTRRYTNPVKYLLAFAALSVFATLSLGVLERQAELVAPGAAGHNPRVDRYLELMSRYLNIALLLGIPFLAAFTRLLFRRAGFNFAEHLIFNTYAYAHQTAIFLPFAVAIAFAPQAFGVLMLGYTVAMTGYYLWASERFFLVGKVRGALLASTAVALGYASYSLVALVVFGIAGRVP